MGCVWWARLGWAGLGVAGRQAGRQISDGFFRSLGVCLAVCKVPCGLCRGFDTGDCEGGVYAIINLYDGRIIEEFDAVALLVLCQGQLLIVCSCSRRRCHPVVRSRQILGWGLLGDSHIQTSSAMMVGLTSPLRVVG